MYSLRLLIDFMENVIYSENFKRFSKHNIWSIVNSLLIFENYFVGDSSTEKNRVL